jgi:outer membrane protein
MKNLFLFIIIFLLKINYAMANTEIVFINMEQILSTSKPGMSILEQLNTLNKENKKILQADQEELKKKETNIISQKNILSKKEFQIKIDDLKKEITIYNNKSNKKVTNFNELKIDSTNKFLQQINPILKDYSEKNSISMILQKKNLILGKIELDITNEIIEIINNDIKKFKIK